MSIALPVFFGLIGLGSIAVIWHTFSANWHAIVDLHRRMGMPECGSEFMVTLRNTPVAFDPLASVRRPRQVRVPAPKPITHRIHHFIKSRAVA